ncbi:hypothetical protein D9615_004027 [Tricholomella constricta]|uniref:Uncharacterized protein n=1 Tax=Tricholomella constricta TaxID=117010 RepID=A0A8H5HCQ4_9AGAR|nr:hypothetical protein D9615_004027 [Tricholomella constricta]
MSRSSTGPSHTDPNPRAVNNLLHTLRGEQFRHSQNLQRIRTHVSATLARNSPTLPIDLSSPDYPLDRPPAKAEASHSSAYKNCPGPEAPKSWTLTSKEVAEEDTPVWRARAVSLVLPSPPPIPSLSNLCLRVLAALSTQQFKQDIIPHLPSHLQRDLVRQSAIYSPLSSAKLYALCEPDGHTDTELVVVGPNATLRDDYFIRATRDTDNVDSHSNNKEDASWDSERECDVDPLRTFVLMSTRLATSSLLSLPPTITRMALINLPTPIALHRLPGTCPLLVVLDLSYNTWLGLKSGSAEKILDRVEWSRWSHLRVLGLRECHVSIGMLVKLNRGRWDDVEIVQ